MHIIIYQNKDEPKVETFEITQLDIKNTHTYIPIIQMNHLGDYSQKSVLYNDLTII